MKAEVYLGTRSRLFPCHSRYNGMDIYLHFITSWYKFICMKFIKDLLQRRVPQILGIYLATSWAIIEFLDWLINQFSISPHLPRFILLTLVSMIPTVILIAYFHGKPGKDEWTRVEKIGIPTNVVVAILMLIFVFQGKDLGATTSLVTLENEEGEVVERVIPKSEFRKKIMVFFLDNASGDTTLNWLSYGITNMLAMDLQQDIYMEVSTGYETASSEKMKEADYGDLTGLPLMLEKEIAQDLHTDYFLSGSFAKENQQYQVDAKLYHSRNGKLINQFTLGDENVFNLVDQLTVQLKHDLQIPEYHIEEADDLPVSEITTASLVAYESYSKGFSAFIIHQDWLASIQHVNEAIKADSTFALAYLNLYQLYLLNSQTEQAAWIFDPLMKYLYKMPEKLQFQAKASYYELRQDFDRQFACFEMLTSLYPDDIQARLALIILLKIRNELDEAIAAYEYILELDPERYTILAEIGSIYKQQGNYEVALDYYERYAEHFSDRPESFRSLGNLYVNMGNFEEARTCYEKSLLLDPGSISNMLLLADLDSRTGNFNQASIQLKEALEQSGTSREKAMVYESFQEFHELRGEHERALEYLYLKQAEWEKIYAPLLVTTSKIGTFYQFAKLESEESAFDTLEILSTQLDALLKDFISLGYLFLYLELEDMEKAEEELVKVEALITAMKLEVLRTIELYARGRIHEYREEYDQAVEHYLEQMEIDPTDTEIYVDLGRCYTKQLSYKKSEEILQKALDIQPYSPDVNYQMALFCYETGKKEDALEHLNRVLSIWENADPDFEPAINARETLKEWEK